MNPSDRFLDDGRKAAEGSGLKAYMEECGIGEDLRTRLFKYIGMARNDPEADTVRKIIREVYPRNFESEAPDLLHHIEKALSEKTEKD